MGIPTLIADNSSDTTDLSAVEFTSGITIAYDEYMFVFTDIGPATDQVKWRIGANAVGESGFNEISTTTLWRAEHGEDGTGVSFGYADSYDQAQSTDPIILALHVGNDADQSVAGILHLFSPASTTYVKHFYATINMCQNTNFVRTHYIAGYFNITAAIDGVQFSMSGGNFDGLVQMYGIE